MIFSYEVYPRNEYAMTTATTIKKKQKPRFLLFLMTFFRLNCPRDSNITNIRGGTNAIPTVLIHIASEIKIKLRTKVTQHFQGFSLTEPKLKRARDEIK